MRRILSSRMKTATESFRMKSKWLICFFVFFKHPGLFLDAVLFCQKSVHDCIKKKLKKSYTRINPDGLCLKSASARCDWCGRSLSSSRPLRSQICSRPVVFFFLSLCFCFFGLKQKEKKKKNMVAQKRSEDSSRQTGPERSATAALIA